MRRRNLAIAVSAAVLIAAGAAAPAASGATACPASAILDPPRLAEVGDGPTHSASGDFNRDGHTDVAYANFCDHEVAVLLGDGHGGFARPRSVGVGFLPATIVTDDFDGDRRLDLAVANSGDHDVSILRGDGRGGFAPSPRTYGVGNSPRGLVSGDFNEDRVPDLAVANLGAAPFPLGCPNQPAPTKAVVMDPSEHRVAILLGDGRGGFSDTRFFDAGPNPGRIAAGDLNRDGRLDLAAGNTRTGTVTVLSGDGRGGFDATATLGVGALPLDVAVEDLSGDGVLDIATADQAGSTISLLAGLGDGRFAGRRSFAVSSPRDIAVADLNGDRILDLAVTHGSNVALMLGTGGGSFGDQDDPDHFADLASGGGGLVEPVLAVRLDGDRGPDLVLGLAGYDLAGEDRVAVLLNRCLRRPTPG